MADTSKDARDLYLDSVFVESGVASMTHEKLKALLAERDDFAALERDQAACVAAQDTEIAKLKASLRAYVALDRKHVTEIEHLESRVAALESAARVVCSEFYQQHPLIKALAAALDAAAPAPQSDDTEENMRRLGHAVMDRIAAHTKDAGGPLEDWTPAECPSEVIDDLIDMIESLRACNAAPAVSQAAADVLAEHPDTKRLDLIQGEYLMVDTFAMPTGGGDADVGWTIAQYYESEDKPRELVRFYVDDVRGAIDAAQRYFDHEPEPLNSPVERLDRAAQAEREG